MTRALSGVFWNLNRGWESAKFVVDKPISFVHMCYESKKDHIKKNKLPFTCLASVKFKWFLSSIVTKEIFQRCVICDTRAFPCSTAAFIILTINFQRRVMLQALYVFCAHML